MIIILEKFPYYSPKLTYIMAYKKSPPLYDGLFLNRLET